jgi:hypothetical protein
MIPPAQPLATRPQTHPSGHNPSRGPRSPREDVAGAGVHPWSATVAFHEGQHGMDCLEFLKEEQVPRFEGRAGMTMALFRVACEQFGKAWTVYQNQMSEFSRTRTDDVGAVRGKRPHLVLTSATPHRSGASDTLSAPRD